MSIPRLGLAYGVGLLVQAAVFGQFAFNTYAWKNGLGIGVAVVALSAAALVRTPRKRATAELVGIAALAALSVLLDSRSYLATFLLATWVFFD